MINEHLSEEDLQGMAMGQQLPDGGIIQHIEGCSSCQEQIAVYKLMYSVIKEQPAAAFDFDLTAAVLYHVQPTRTKRATIHFRPLIIAVFAGVSLYFFRKNFLHLVSGISALFLLISIITCIGIIIFKAVSMYHTYERQIEKLNFSE